MEYKRKKTILAVSLILFCMSISALAAETPATSGTTALAPAGPNSVKTPSMLDMFHNPTPWLEMGADIRIREHFGHNWTTLNNRNDTSGGFWHWQRYRARWWTKLKLNEDVDINMRLTYEYRNYENPPSKRSNQFFNDVIIDNLNLTLRKFAGLPATLVVGRQDIKLGEGWLVADGTPLDGSRTFYFDAVRVTYDLTEKRKLDLIYINQHPNPDWWLCPMNNQQDYVTLEQEQGAILYLTDKTFAPAQLEGYFIYKNDNPVNGTTQNLPTSNAIRALSKKAETYTFGGAISSPFWDKWSYRVEGAIQTGSSASPNPVSGANPNGTENDQTERLLAWGEKATLEYSFKDTLDNKLHVTYEYLSGDNPDTKRVTSFNPLWGAWPQWSELYQPYVTSMENGLVSNLHRLDFGHKFKPTEKWEILTDYNLLWADQNTYKSNAKFTSDNNFRGQLITCWARYNLTKNIKGNLIGEYFMPGNYYASGNRDNALYFHFTVEFLF